VVIRQITIAVLAAALAGAVLAVPALSKSGPAVVAKKKAKKCKKGKKGKAKKRKGCKRGGSSGVGLPGQATPSKPTPPDPPTTPPTLHVASVGVAANPVFAGNSTTGQVTIDAAAPAGGQQVNLQSSAPSVSVPGSVLVAAGQTSASFSIDTTTGVAATATLTGSIGASTATTQLSVVDTASVSSVKLERQCFTTGPFTANRVTLDVPAPEDTVVTLLSSDDTALAVPPSVTVPSGSTSALFSVNALLASSSVTVTATLGTSQATDSASVSATTPDPKASGLTLSPESINPAGSSTGTVTLDCEAPPGTQVTVTSSDPSILVPTTVDVPAGALSVDFTVTTDGASDGNYTIFATAGGVTQDATLTVSSSLPT
jgi:hypothetical protein